MQEQLSFGEMVQNLLQVDDEAWANYAFSREILRHRISVDKKSEMIIKAIACGKTYANHILLEVGSSELQSIAKYFNLSIEFGDTLIIGKRLVFAYYTPPDNIQIMEGPINEAMKLVLNEDLNMIKIFSKDDIIEIILGHEIFHFVEEQHGDEIYTRNEKILLWKLMGFKNYSTIHILSEIAAMAFIRELKGLSYSPFILDFILYYSYDTLGAKKIYRDILGNSSRRCMENIKD